MNHQRLYTYLLTVLLSMAAVGAKADGEWTSGSCKVKITGENMTVSGYGDMADYTITQAPWYAENLNVKKLVIEEGVTTVGTKAFANFYTLESVTIPNSVTSIGDKAFVNCFEIKTLSLNQDSKLTTIGEAAFSHCEGLTAFTSPQNLSSVGDYSFEYCAGLKSFTIPQGMKFIPKGLLYGCSGLTTITIPRSVRTINMSAFQGCKGLTTLAIPESVTTIAASAFKGCSGLTTITIPYGVTSIGDKAFGYCTAATNVYCYADIDKLLWRIDSADFKKGILTDIHVINVEAWKKKYGTKLKHFEQAKPTATGNCGAQGEEVKWECYHDGPLIISGTGEIPDYNDVYTPWKSHKDDITSIVIKKGVTRVGSYAFYEFPKNGYVSLPDNLKSIGNHAFGSNQQLPTVTIPSSVKSIGVTPFDGCKIMEDIYFHTLSNNLSMPEQKQAFAPNDQTKCHVILKDQWQQKFPEATKNYVDVKPVASGSCGAEGDNLKWAYYPDILVVSGTGNMADYASGNYAPWAFLRKTMKYVMVSPGVKSLGNNAFQGDTCLLVATIPSSVTSVGDQAFQKCSQLITATFKASSLTKYGAKAFDDCSDSLVIYVPFSAINTYQTNWAAYKERIRTNSVANGNCGDKGDNCKWNLDSEGILIISGTGAMKNYNPNVSNAPWYNNKASINTVIIEPGVTTIGSYAFYECPSITSFTIPEGVTTIEENAFLKCSGSFSITIPGTMTTVGARAFSLCSGITSVSIPSSVTKIGYWAFSRCTNLTSVELPEGLTFLGGAFHECNALTSINIPSTVTTIEMYAFYNTALTSIDIPANVTSIGKFVFGRCTALNDVYCYADPEKLTWDVDPRDFKADKATKFHVKNKAAWEKKFSNVNVTFVEMTPEVTGTCGAEGDNLKWSFHRGCLTISGKGKMADYNDNAPWRSYNDSIKKITMELGVTSIGAQAFRGCTSLTSVTIPGGVTTIGDKAFYGCSAMTDVYCKAALDRLTWGDASQDFKADKSTRCHVTEKAGWEQKFSSVNVTFAEMAFIASGTCGEQGDNVKWYLYKDGSMVFTGQGDMSLYQFFRAPWGPYMPWIKSAIFVGDIKSVAWNSFAHASKLQFVILPRGLTKIGVWAFIFCDAITEFTFPSTLTYIGQSAFGCGGVTDIYCYADPEKFVWSPVSGDFKADKATKFHVADKAAWEKKFPDANVTFVGDLKASMKGLEGLEGLEDATSVNEELRMNEEFATARWYTPDGRKLTGKPTQKGIYIMNGKKIVIR